MATVSVVKVERNVEIAHLDSASVSIEYSYFRTEHTLFLLEHFVLLLVESPEYDDFMLVDLLTP